MKHLTIPDLDTLSHLHCGEEVLLSGTLYTARDAAHKRLAELIAKNRTLPFPLKNSFLYYSGPTPAPPSSVIGSCGPTTSKRMDRFTPLLLEHGVKGIIGKGPRKTEIFDAFSANRALYFHAYGGCGALYNKSVMDCQIVAFADLGPEAIYKLSVKDFPVLVAFDLHGKNIFHYSDI